MSSNENTLVFRSKSSMKPHRSQLPLNKGKVVFGNQGDLAQIAAHSASSFLSKELTGRCFAETQRDRQRSQAQLINSIDSLSCDDGHLVDAAAIFELATQRNNEHSGQTMA